MPDSTEREATTGAAYRMISSGKVAFVPPTEGYEDLPPFLRRLADAVEQVNAEVCDPGEGVSHVQTYWCDGEGWNGLLVIE